jgi:hypothetical protein
MRNLRPPCSIAAQLNVGNLPTCDLQRRVPALLLRHSTTYQDKVLQISLPLGQENNGSRSRSEVSFKICSFPLVIITTITTLPFFFFATCRLFRYSTRSWGDHYDLREFYCAAQANRSSRYTCPARFKVSRKEEKR